MQESSQEKKLGELSKIRIKTQFTMISSSLCALYREKNKVFAII